MLMQIFSRETSNGALLGWTVGTCANWIEDRLGSTGKANPVGSVESWIKGDLRVTVRSYFSN